MSCLRCSNPATSERQRKFMCSELGRQRAGKTTQTGMTEQQLKDFCMKKNPMSVDKAAKLARKTIDFGKDVYKTYKENPVRVISHKQAFVLTKKIVAYAKKLYAHEKKGMKHNPGEAYHSAKFQAYMIELSRYESGSIPYLTTLAKAYEHLESQRESMR